MENNGYSYNNDSKLIDELTYVRAENASLYREVQSLKELNEFLRLIINSFISK